MHDAALVRGFERVGDLARNRQRFVQRNGSLRDAIGERRAVDQFEDERPYVGRVLPFRPADHRRFFDPVDLRDVRMVERGQHLRLALKSRDAIGIGRKELREYFYGDIAIQPRIARTIHLAHAAGAEGGNNRRTARVEYRVQGTSFVS